MRVGVNPLRDSMAPDKAPKVVAAVITHLPNQIGYHKKRLAIVKACLQSMRENAGMKCDVMVWDNGSCNELKDWLVSSYHPSYMMLSPNIGKGSAKAGILRMFPENTMVGISDDDMLFYPGWLDEQVKLIRHFPNVGAVSGYPCRRMIKNNSSTLKWADENGAAVTIGRSIPDEWEIDYAVSIEYDPQEWLDFTKDDTDTMIEYLGVKAYATAHHCQAVYVAGRVVGLTNWDSMAAAAEGPWDEAIDQAGMLRLATVERMSRHMGNIIDPKLKSELESMGLL
jgi:hypothetical protein